MRLIKKDWMEDLNTVVFIGAVVLAGISVMFLWVSFMVPEERAFFEAGYEQLHNMVIGVLSIYPLWCFAAISPQIKNGKVYLNTANLPFSKKTLFVKGLKPWFIFYPVVILASSVVMALLSEPTQSFRSLFLFSLMKSAVIFVFIFLMTLQIIAGIIFCSVKQVKWYKVTGILIIFNGCLIGLCVLAGFLSSINMNNSRGFMVGVILTLLLGSVPVFLLAWKDVERIHQ